MNTSLHDYQGGWVVAMVKCYGKNKKDNNIGNQWLGLKTLKLFRCNGRGRLFWEGEMWSGTWIMRIHANILRKSIIDRGIKDKKIHGTIRKYEYNKQ